MVIMQRLFKYHSDEWKSYWLWVHTGDMVEPSHTLRSTSSPFMCMERLLKWSNIWSVASCCSVTSSP